METRTIDSALDGCGSKGDGSEFAVAVQLNSVATVEVREVTGKTGVTTLGVIGLLGLLAVGVYAILASIAPDLGGWGETARWY